MPDKPPTPTLVSQSATQITIEWGASFDGGSEINDYIVMADIGGTSFSALSPTTGSKLIRSYSITTEYHNIINGIIYSFKVVAKNAVGLSE